MKHIRPEKIDENRWRIPRSGAMRTDGIVYAGSDMMAGLEGDESLRQVVNVACLPGIVGPSLAMPDIHAGYGFPIGGVAAFDADEGVVSPGGVGYDINCGVRMLRTGLAAADIRDSLRQLVEGLFVHIPAGIGSKRSDFTIGSKEYRAVLQKGAAWAIEQGFGSGEDLACIEDSGCIEGADPDGISDRACERGRSQLGTLGSGNHFVEISWVDQVYDEECARDLGLSGGGITVTIHTGSRGFGYQVCDDSLKVMLRAARKYGIDLPDRQLCCAPVASPEGRAYLGAMACAANYAFANRQIIGHRVQQVFERVLGLSPRELRMGLVYDVCHNIAKLERHVAEGQERTVCVHRKGATRAFPPGHPQVPPAYRRCGQPVLIPGDMGRCSYVLVGAHKAMEQTFGSACHGAGRLMSRQQARKAARGRTIPDELEQRGVIVRAAGRSTLAEEMPEAYKDVSTVVDVVHAAGIALKVARLKPLAVLKG